MTYKPLRYVHDSENCEGNLLPDCLYLSEESKLVIVGHCALCGSHIQVSLTMEYLLTNIPPSEQKPLLLNPQELREDAEFLHHLGINPD